MKEKSFWGRGRPPPPGIRSVEGKRSYPMSFGLTKDSDSKVKATKYHAIKFRSWRASSFNRIFITTARKERNFS